MEALALLDPILSMRLLAKRQFLSRQESLETTTSQHLPSCSEKQTMLKISKEIRDILFKKQDLKYRDFSAKLTPTIDKELFIGVRVPKLREIAKQYKSHEKIEDFIDDLPHKYVEENTLHGLLLSELKDYDEVVKRLDIFLPYVDNWATCDIISPKIFKKNREKLKADIDRWMGSNESYTIRFGVEMVMAHYLDEDFDCSFATKVARIRSDEYYVNMMKAWYFATALAKQWDAIIPFVEKHKLDDWSHNKAIQKARESYRITDKQKKYLLTLKK